MATRSAHTIEIVIIDLSRYGPTYGQNPGFKLTSVLPSHSSVTVGHYRSLADAESAAVMVRALLKQGQAAPRARISPQKW
jgi:hypothetical protein